MHLRRTTLLGYSSFVSNDQSIPFSPPIRVRRAVIFQEEVYYHVHSRIKVAPWLTFAVVFGRDRFESTASAGRRIPSASPIDLPLPIPEDRIPGREAEDGRGLRRANISKWQPKQTQQ